MLEFLIAEYPQALIAAPTPLRIATLLNRRDDITSLLAATATAIASRDYTTLTSLVHTDLRSTNLAILGPARLLTSVSILICLRRLTLERLACGRDADLLVLKLVNRLSLDASPSTTSPSPPSRSSAALTPRSLATYGPPSSRYFRLGTLLISRTTNSSQSCFT